MNYHSKHICTSAQVAFNQAEKTCLLLVAVKQDLLQDV